jgi:hypothetical protein
VEKLKSRGEKPFKEYREAIQKEWNGMTPEQKKEYNDVAAKEFEIYKEDLNKWELKMVRLGNTDLVREKAIIEKSSLKPPMQRRKKFESSDSD